MIRAKLARHHLAFVFAVVVGFIASAPYVLAPLVLGEAYRGVQVQLVDNEDTYRAEIAQLVQGRSFASPYLQDPVASSDAPLPSVNQWFYAIPAMFFGLSAVLLASKFILPALLFGLVYVFVNLMLSRSGEGKQLVALSAALAVTLGYALVDISHVKAIVQGGDALTPLIWTRPVNPIIGGLEVFGALILLIATVERHFRYAFVGLGILLALTVGYFFSYAFVLAVTGVLFLIMMVRKEYRVARDLVAAVILAFVLDAQYWYVTLTAVSGEEGRALALRNGMTFTHEPVLNLVLAATTISVLCLYVFARWKRLNTATASAWIYILASLAGSWLVFNQQIITGREIWYPHFVQYTIPVCFVSLFVTFYLAVRPVAPRLWKVTIVCVCAAILLYGVRTMQSFEPRLTEFATVQADAEVFSILNTDPSGCVAYVLTPDSTLERLVPAYTHCSVYSTSFVFYGVPSERILHNYLLYLRLSGVHPSNARKYLLAHPEEIRLYFSPDWQELFATDSSAWLLSEVDRLEGLYHVFARKDLKQQLQQYQMDYLITETPLASGVLKQLPGLFLATTTSRYFLYSF